MVVYLNYLDVWGDIDWCGNFCNISRECIFLMDKCKQASSSGGIGHSLLYTSCEGMCVVKNKFEFWE